MVTYIMMIGILASMIFLCLPNSIVGSTGGTVR